VRAQGPVDLTDLTIIVPFRLDLPDRLRNLRIVANSILSRFDTTILVAELDAAPQLNVDDLQLGNRGGRLRHLFFEDEEGSFHRTRAVNLGAGQVQTPFLAIHDADIVLPGQQYADAMEQLRQQRCEMCLPFANRVMWVLREDVPALDAGLDDALLAELAYPVSDDNHLFLGLVNLLSTPAFFEAGLMNEHFRSWGYEEVELHMRLLKLGCRVLRTDGIAYHLGHADSGSPDADDASFQANLREYHRIVALNPDDLRDEIATWPWAIPADGGSGVIP
jgi:hypothetical protein